MRIPERKRNVRSDPLSLNRKIVFTLLSCAICLAGCRPGIKSADESTSSGIQVFFKLDTLLLGPTYGGPRWVLPPFGPYRISGNRYVLDARAEFLDVNGQPIGVVFDWTPENPEMLKVTPGQDNTVEIRILRPGESLVRVTAQGQTKTFTIRAEIFEETAIEIEIAP